MAQQVKDWVLLLLWLESQLWHEFNPWPGNFRVLQVWPKEHPLELCQLLPAACFIGFCPLLWRPLCRTLAVPFRSKQEAQENGYLDLRPAELCGRRGSWRYHPRDTQLSTTRASSHTRLPAPPPGSQCGSGAERGLPRLLPQVHALAGGTAAGGHGQGPPRTAAEVGPFLGAGRGASGLGSHTDATLLWPKSPAPTRCSGQLRPPILLSPPPGQRPCRAPSC